MRILIRFISQECKRLSISLEQHRPFQSSANDKAKNMAQSRPVTVRNNLKFKLHDEIERKFLIYYPDLIHTLTAEFAGGLPSLSNRTTKLLTNNLSTSVIGKRYGLLVPRSYKELGGQEEEQEAIVLGWAVELIRAANNLTAEIIHDLEKNRRGQLTWHRKNMLGQSALAHVKIVESCVFLLLRKHFASSPSYPQLIQLFVESLQHQATSYSLDLKLNMEDGVKLQDYDMWRYKSLVYSTKTFPCLVLPVSLALHLADLHQDAVHEQSKQILTEIGLLHQVQQDFENCFKHSAEGDIARGRITWLIVLATQRASSAQLKELEALYGTSAPEAIARVKEIYTDLKLHKNIPIYLEEKMSDIDNYIQQMAKVDSVGLSQSLFFKIHGDISSDNFTFIQSPSQ